jgi:hypothetical protein
MCIAEVINTIAEEKRINRTMKNGSMITVTVGITL